MIPRTFQNRYLIFFWCFSPFLDGKNFYLKTYELKNFFQNENVISTALNDRARGEMSEVEQNSRGEVSEVETTKCESILQKEKERQQK